MEPEQPASRPRRTELWLRVISSALLIPPSLAAVMAGGPIFAALVTVIAALALWEWLRMSAADAPLSLHLLSIACLVAGLLALAAGAFGWAVALIAAPAGLAFLLGMRSPSFGWIGLGLLYVAIPCAAFIILRRAGPSGWAVILFTLIVVWATDIAAYFGGRALGGPKLWARISPKKTWSGALTGLAGAVVAGGLVAAVTGVGTVLAGCLLAAPLSAAAQAGDLLESAFKRRFGAKDSGNLIPGHGGVLDRMDGVFGAATLAWILAWILAATGAGGGVLGLPRDIAALPGGMS